jgi:hypothetical protein
MTFPHLDLYHAQIDSQAVIRDYFDTKVFARWKKTSIIYHATDETRQNSFAEVSQTLVYPGANNLDSARRVSLFSRNLWNNRQPDISPFGTHRFDLPVETAFDSPRDFLIPINEPLPSGGNVYIDMLYLKRQDVVNANLAKTLQHWRLEKNPYIQWSGSEELLYRHAEKVWWVLLIPYEITLPETCEPVRPTERPFKSYRCIENRELIRNRRTHRLLDAESFGE